MEQTAEPYRSLSGLALIPSTVSNPEHHWIAAFAASRLSGAALAILTP